MSRSQLRKDLFIQIGRKHEQWRTDASNLYEMAGLPGTDCVEDIVAVMIYELAIIANLCKLPDSLIARSVEEARANLNKAGRE